MCKKDIKLHLNVYRCGLKEILPDLLRKRIDLFTFFPFFNSCALTISTVFELCKLPFLLLRAVGDTTFLDRIHFGCQANRDLFCLSYCGGIVAILIVSSQDSTCLHDRVYTICACLCIEKELALVCDYIYVHW